MLTAGIYRIDSMDKINVAEKFALFADYCNPRVIGELNDSHVKVVKLKGDFIWHHHDNEDELFFVVKGTLRMWVRDAQHPANTGGDDKSGVAIEREIVIRPGEFIIIPRGTEHLPKADPDDNNGECHIILLEPKTPLNTGNVTNERTVANLQRL
jgi:mannose-6-phosphate isomerase-like protein (cupin superfamily)